MVGISIRKGSCTIEAACVMPLLFLVIFGCLYLCFFVHNRAWLTAAASEAAVSGSMEGIFKEGEPYETARKKAGELGNIGFFGMENLTVQVHAGKKVSVVYDADTIVPVGGMEWHLRAEGSSKIIHPVEWIRKVKAAAELVGQGIG